MLVWKIKFYKIPPGDFRDLARFPSKKQVFRLPETSAHPESRSTSENPTKRVQFCSEFVLNARWWYLTKISCLELRFCCFRTGPERWISFNFFKFPIRNSRIRISISEHPIIFVRNAWNPIAVIVCDDKKFSIPSIVSETSIFWIPAFWDFHKYLWKFESSKFEFSLWRILRQIFFRSYPINTTRYQLLTADSDGLPWCVRKIVTYFGFLNFVILQIYQESRSSQISKCYQ